MQRFRFLVLVLLCGFCVAALAIAASGLSDESGSADMIVVPGNTVTRDGTPSPRLRARLDAALALFQQQRAPLIFVSGGKGVEGIDEAGAMADYLVKQGVPAAAIVRDSLGVDTAATARNATRYLRAHRLGSALVATQYFHVPRTRLALEREGVRVTGTAHARYFELRDLYSLPREVVAYAAYWVRR